MEISVFQRIPVKNLYAWSIYVDFKIIIILQEHWVPNLNIILII